MDQSLWQTFGAFDFLHSSLVWIQTMLSCGAHQCRMWLFQDSDFAGDLEDWKSTSVGILCIFGSHTLLPISWMCTKQTSVSHCSTEAEIISLDTGLRMDGIPALDLWILVTGRTVAADKDQKSLKSLGEICHKHRWIWGSWIPRMFTKVKRSRRFRRFRRFRTWKSKLAASFPHVTWICASHGEGLLDRKKDLWSETDGQVERPRCEHCDLVHTHVCHTSSGSSSWTRSFGGFKIRQESTFEVRNTIILHNWETDQSADGNRRIVHDWPEVAYVERIISTVTELFEFWIPKPTSFPLGALLGRHHYRTSWSKERQG